MFRLHKLCSRHIFQSSFTALIHFLYSIYQNKSLRIPFIVILFLKDDFL